MKQELSEIPVWEAFEENKTECPLCSIVKKHEEKLIESIYSEMVMDYKFYTKLGEEYCFCKDHLEKLYRSYDKLGLAIMLDKILESRIKELHNCGKKYKRQTKKLTDHITNFFKGRHKHLEQDKSNHCFICSNLEEFNNTLANILLKLWISNNEFKQSFKNSKGFCLSHFNLLLEQCNSMVNTEKESNGFIVATIAIQRQNMKRL